MKLSLFSALFAAVLMCSSGYAQTINARAYIPFNFQVGETTMPAGNYSIRNSKGLLTIHNSDKKTNIFHLTRKELRSTASRDAKLEFTRYGEDYYLTNVWDAGSSEGVTLPQGKHEKDLANRFRKIEMASVDLQPTTH